MGTDLSTSLDRRSRTAADRLDHTVDEVLDAVLPSLVHGPHHDVAARAAAELGLEPLAITAGGRTVVLDPTGGDLVLRSGSSPTEATATAYGLSRLVTDQTSAPVLMIEGELSVARGPIDLWLQWEPVVRALLSGWEVHRPGAIDLVDRHGDPIDVTRVFTPDDDPADVGHFVAECGFLHARGLFPPAEVRALQQGAERLLATARPGHELVSTNRTSTGAEVVNAVREVAVLWPEVADLLATPSFAALGSIVPGTTWEVPTTGNLQHKPFDVAEGFSNTPWHRDCGPGGHSYRCCVLRAGIGLTQDHDGTGRFGAIAGSHRANVSANPLTLPSELPKHLLTCEPGDVHLHLSCTFHCGTPATTAHRRVLYADFLLPGSPAVDDSAYRDGKVSAAVGGAVAASALLAGGT